MNKAMGLSLFLSLLLFLPAGCKSSQKVFKVTSYPQGATIFVDGKQRGVTDMEKVNVSFDAKPQATIRVEKEGFQSDGINVSMESQELILFVLQEAPNNKQIIKGLEKISDKMDALIEQIRKSMAEKANP